MASAHFIEWRLITELSQPWPHTRPCLEISHSQALQRLSQTRLCSPISVPSAAKDRRRNSVVPENKMQNVLSLLPQDATVLELATCALHIHRENSRLNFGFMHWSHLGSERPSHCITPSFTFSPSNEGVFLAPWTHCVRAPSRHFGATPCVPASSGPSRCGVQAVLYYARFRPERAAS